MIDDLPPLRDVIATHGLSAQKSLGQNFLLDLNITSKIARLAGDLTDVTVVEIGPGPGGLTRGLLAGGAKHVIAVEKDKRCLPILEQVSDYYPGRLSVISGDALTDLDLDSIDGPVRIVANLPYNVGTELLTTWLSAKVWPPKWLSLTLMFQKEVAERITANTGSKAYGRLSILSNWRANTAIVYNLPPGAFTPPPKVSSAVVHITPTAPKVEVDAQKLSQITKAAFGQRRKMLRASLKSILRDTENTLKAIDIDPTRRAETLTLEEFSRIANSL